MTADVDPVVLGYLQRNGHYDSYLPWPPMERAVKAGIATRRTLPTGDHRYELIGGAAHG